MVDADQTFVIVGAGLAGAKAAETLRAEGFTGRVILIGDERDHPYERPPLSKGYLTRQARSATASSSTNPPGTREHDVELHLGQPVVAPRPRRARPSRLGDGTLIHYDKLLLATGAEPRRLDIPGTDLAGVHHLRRLAHAERLKGVLAALGRENGHLVIAGRGLDRPGGRGRGPRVRRRGHRRRARADPAARGARPRARRSSSPSCTASTASASTSAPGSPRSPARTAWCWPPAPTTARSTPPTTSSPRSAPPRAPPSPRPPGLAIADRARRRRHRRRRLAAHLRPGHLRRRRRRQLPSTRCFGTRLRVEHWANALNGGPAAARAMLGQDVDATTVCPYFFSDQYDLGHGVLRAARRPGSYDQVVVPRRRRQAGVHRLLAAARAGCWPG